MNIILASKSPRRIELLKSIGMKFTSCNSNINENKISKHMPPAKYCKNLSYLKASTVLKNNNDKLIIGADTIVCCNNEILGKPKNKKDALNLLRKLNNKTHYVYTGISMISKDYNHSFHDKTSVTFNMISVKEFKYYIDNFNPFDKAGSYGIQDWSKVFIKKINGCYYNVMGFPISKFYNYVNKYDLLKKDFKNNE